VTRPYDPNESPERGVSDAGPSTPCEGTGDDGGSSEGEGARGAAGCAEAPAAHRTVPRNAHKPLQRSDIRCVPGG
jgi:hypothetical protein